jgi:hypothetical protein
MNERAVIEYLAGVVGAGFLWGETDCATLALRALDRWTGLDCSSRFAGAWGTQAEALAMYAEGYLPSDYLRQLGGYRITPAMATLGDVVTLQSEAWPEQVHFLTGSHATVADIEAGVRLVKSALILSIPGAEVWRVPCRKPCH